MGLRGHLVAVRTECWCRGEGTVVEEAIETFASELFMTQAIGEVTRAELQKLLARRAEAPAGGPG